MKRNKRFIAVTGGIGSGKSAVMRCLDRLGYPVFSADAIARNIYDDADIARRVRAMFPECFDGGLLDRKKLADVVFSSPEALRRLEGVTHPAIMARLFSQMEAAAGRLVFAEVPLLFEGGFESDFDGVIVVMRDFGARLRSVMKRDGCGEQEALARFRNQRDYEKNPPIGHTVIYNDGDLAALNLQVVRVVHEILAEADT